MQTQNFVVALYGHQLLAPRTFSYRQNTVMGVIPHQSAEAGIRVPGQGVGGPCARVNSVDLLP